MSKTTQHAGHRRGMIAAVASAVLALVGAVVLLMAARGSDAPPQPPVDASQALPAQVPNTTTSAGTRSADSSSARPSSPRTSGVTRQPKETDLGPILNASAPVGIDIPSIGVRTKNFVDLGRASDGSLEVPKDFSAVGWYTQGATPGQLGSAILAGHVDDHNGPAIFYRLGALRPGAEIKVARKDGSTATFSVDRTQRFAKNAFPTAQVYGSTNRADLRLITCGGSFDQKSGHYVDNVVAFAHLVG